MYLRASISSRSECGGGFFLPSPIPLGLLFVVLLGVVDIGAVVGLGIAAGFAFDVIMPYIAVTRLLIVSCPGVGPVVAVSSCRFYPVHHRSSCFLLLLSWRRPGI